MPKRYYISKIIGDGLRPETAFRPKVETYGVSWAGSIPTDANGQPLFQHVLVIVNTNNHAVLKNDPDIGAMPDFPLDGKVSAIQNNVKSQAYAMLAAKGFNTATLDGNDGYRDLISAVGKQRDSNFDVDNFDVN